MKYFLELLEIARSQGVLSYDKDAQTHRKYRPQELNELFDRLENCQPFVFMPKNDEPVELLSDQMVLYENMPLSSAPFPVFSLEVLGGAVCSPRSTDEVKVTIYCIVCVEKSPNVWDYVTLVNSSNPKKINSLEDLLSQLKKEPEAPKLVVVMHDVGSVVEELLTRLNKEKLGSESVRERIKIGVGDRKRTHTLRKIIHVVSKKEYERVKSDTTKKIDWTHRWASRGHWRSNPGRLGKNRDGQYCVQDWTWVSESIKGPEGSPLISKTRMVDE